MKRKILFVILVLFLITIPVSAQEKVPTVVPIYVCNYEIKNRLQSEDFLYPVYRVVDGRVPITNSIKALLEMEFTSIEKDLGFTSEFTDERAKNVTLDGVDLRDGKLILWMSDPDFFTSGGSKRVTVLKKQIEATALQFDVVDQVVFVPDHLFEP